tara:strand:+ start:44 stop:268 length:225 start_codon:yes stop_codon:yes gene_type:complete
VSELKPYFNRDLIQNAGRTLPFWKKLWLKFRYDYFTVVDQSPLAAYYTSFITDNKGRIYIMDEHTVLLRESPDE